jgi:hypothetical protein
VHSPAPSSPPAAELPFHEHIRQQLTGDRYIAVYPEPAKLKGVWLQPGESALALADASVFGNASSGVLLTTSSLRVLGEGRQIDVAAIVGGPHFPHGDEQAGYVDTVHGPFVLSKYTREISAGVGRIIEAVVAYARGERGSPYAALASRGHVAHAAVATLLSAPQFIPPWNVNALARPGVQRILRGLDHASGETPLAILDETTGGSADEGVVVTTHGVHARSESASERDAHFSVSHAWLVSVALRGGILGQGVELRTAQGLRAISLIRNSESAKQLAAFFNAILAIPAHARFDVGPLAPDPALSRAVAEMPASAEARADFDMRSRLQLANERWGRGTREGWLMSPLSLPDLRAALGAALGAPYARDWDGVHETLDYPLSHGGVSAGNVASSVVGIALLATVGVGWVSTGNGPRVSAVRCRLRDLGPFTGLSLHALSAGGEVHGSPVVRAVSGALVPAERDVLTRRVRAGVDVPSDALFYDAPASYDAPAPWSQPMRSQP